MSSTRRLALLAPLLALAVAVALSASTAAHAQEDRYFVTAAPDFLEVEPGARVVVTAQLFRKGVPTYSNHAWTWKTSGGGFQNGYRTSAAQNIWIAPNRPGKYVVEVTTERAERLGQQASSTFIVRAKHRNLRVTPASVILRPGDVARFSFACDGGWQPGELRWTLSEGGNFESFDTYRAGQVPGAYKLALTDEYTGEVVYVAVSIERRPTLALPAEMVCWSGQTIEIPIHFDGAWRPGRFEWTRVEGGRFATWNSFEAGPTPGRFALEVRDRDTGETATCIVLVQRFLEVTPAEVTLLPGQQQRFEVRSRRAGWRPPELTWTLVGGGTMTAGSLYTAGATPGRFELRLRDGRTGEQTSAWVTIEAPQVHAITVEPRYARARPGMRIQLRVEAFDQENEGVPATVRYEVLGPGGTVTPDGWFVAGRVGGERHVRVRVTCVASGKWDEADIFVFDAPRGPGGRPGYGPGHRPGSQPPGR